MFKEYAKELTAILEEMQSEAKGREIEMAEIVNTSGTFDRDGEFTSGAVEDYYNHLQEEMDVFDDACGWLENAIQALMEG